jgi:hypothetical protein
LEVLALAASGYLIYLEDNMFQFLRRHTGWFSFLFALFGLVALLLAGGIAAQTVTKSEPDLIWEDGVPVIIDAPLPEMEILTAPTTPGTYYRTFAGTHFQSISSALTYSAIGGAIYATDIPSGAFSFTLDLALPHGAEITEVVFFVVDNHAADMSLGLRSYNPATGQTGFLAADSSSGASPSLQTIVIPIDPPVQVDHSTTAYRLRVQPGVGSSSHLLHGARVGYTVPTAYLPFITRE